MRFGIVNIFEMYHRKQNRLKNYDYSQAGCYFVTVCTKGRINHFGEIENGEMKLNDYGKIANDMWIGLPWVFKNITLDEHVVMPNHIHGIISIIDEYPVGNASEHLSGNNTLFENRKKNIETELNAEMRSIQYDKSKMLISKIIQIHKSEVSRRIKRISNGKIKSTIWQKSFYDHVIRNEKEFGNIQEYIRYNPLKWEWDVENKINSGKDAQKYYVNIMNGK